MVLCLCFCLSPGVRRRWCLGSSGLTWWRRCFLPQPSLLLSAPWRNSVGPSCRPHPPDWTRSALKHMHRWWHALETQASFSCILQETLYTNVSIQHPVLIAYTTQSISAACTFYICYLYLLTSDWLFWGPLASVCAVIGAGGPAAESREQAEADEPGAGRTPEKSALSWPKKQRVGGVPAQRALPRIRGKFFVLLFVNFSVFNFLFLTDKQLIDHELWQRNMSAVLFLESRVTLFTLGIKSWGRQPVFLANCVIGLFCLTLD